MAAIRGIRAFEAWKLMIAQTAVPRSIEVSRKQRQSKYSLLQHTAVDEMESKCMQANASFKDMMDGSVQFVECSNCRVCLGVGQRCRV